MRILQFCLLFIAGATCACAAPVEEIESLLRYIGGLEGASFVRNGDVHTPSEAEAHLRLKWSKQKSQITTAEDFIRLCGTKSSVSGKPYMIRFKDGREDEAATVLLKELRAIREAVRPKNRGAPNPSLEPTATTVAHPADEARQPTGAAGQH